MTLGSLAKAAGPVVSSTAFAWSIDRPRPFPFDNHLIFLIFFLGMVIVTASSWDIDISPLKCKPEGGSAVPVVVAEDVPEGGGKTGLVSE